MLSIYKANSCISAWYMLTICDKLNNIYKRFRHILSICANLDKSPVILTSEKLIGSTWIRPAYAQTSLGLEIF